MNFLPQAIDDFVVANTEKEPALLYELSRETWIKTINPRMLAGHLQGRTLSMLSKMLNPKNVLEIGTFTGYSAICIAEGLTKDGKIITIDINEELEDLAHKYFTKAGIGQQVEQRIGNAIDLIPKIDETFDLVFIDADKSNYINYFNLVLPKLKKGGFIIADNVLWSGKVTEEYNSLDADTQTLIDFNKLITKDERVENVLFPIRDGLQIIRKK